MHNFMLHQLVVRLLGWPWAQRLGFLDKHDVMKTGKAQGVSAVRKLTYMCLLQVLLHVSRDWLVGTTQENFAASFAPEILGKGFCVLLGICQSLKHRIGTMNEIKWSISACNLHFLLPPVKTKTKMERNSSGASDWALHLYPVVFLNGIETFVDYEERMKFLNISKKQYFSLRTIRKETELLSQKCSVDI